MGSTEFYYSFKYQHIKKVYINIYNIKSNEKVFTVK